MKARFSLIRQAAAFLMLTAIVFPIFAVGGDVKSKGKALSDDQKVLHVLNRLGFGARPGDVAKVKSIGLQKYIEQQLNPGSAEKPEVTEKLKNFEVLKMSTDEIFAKYPNGGALLRMLEGRNRNNQNAAQNNQNPDQMTEADRRERQEKIRQLYQEYNLRPANQIIYQQASSRIIRAVYSENQLEEQMVDFGEYFNVMPAKLPAWFILSMSAT